MKCLFRILMDAFFLLGVIVTAMLSAHAVTRNYGDTISESTRRVFFILRPAVVFAAGMGLGEYDCAKEEFPELDAFLNQQISEISPQDYPEKCTRSYGEGGHFGSHIYLTAYMGVLFRLFGISVHTFYLACILMHVVAMVSAYLLFRLFMNRVVALLCTLYLSTSPTVLLLIPDFRDYGKFPFFIVVFLLMGFLLRKVHRPGTLLAWSTALGAVIGLGYGFREDLFICLPPAFMLVLLAARTLRFQWRYRIAATVMLLLSFILITQPVRNKAENGEFRAVHTVLAGITEGAENNIPFGDADYDFGFLDFDTPVAASVSAYALRMDGRNDVRCFTPEYSKYGGEMFKKVLFTFPADFFSRALSMAVTSFFLPECRYLSQRRMSEPAVLSEDPVIKACLYVHGCAEPIFLRSGLLFAFAALLVVAFRSFPSAMIFLFLFLYFGAYPSLLAEYRHFFHLAIIPLFFTGLFVSDSLSCRATIWRGVTSKNVRAGLVNISRRFLLTVALLGGLLLFLFGTQWGLRLYQSEQVLRMIRECSSLPLLPFPTITDVRDGKVFIHPEKYIHEQKGKSAPGKEIVNPAYLALKFKKAERTIAFSLLNSNDSFVKPCRIRLDGSGVYYFPAFDYGADPDARFEGIEIAREDLQYVEGVYWVDNAEVLPLWAFLAVPEDLHTFVDHKTGRIDHWLHQARMSFVKIFGFAEKRILEHWIGLLKRYPAKTSYAERALNEFVQSGEMESMELLWETIGRYVPEKRKEASAWFSEAAKRAENKQQLEKALRLYEDALDISPGELWNRVRIGEIQISQGNLDAAEVSFREILLYAPDSPYTATLLDDLFVRKGGDEGMNFWRSLIAHNPDKAVPHLFMGITLERLNDLDGAYDQYLSAFSINPDLAAITYRLGALECLHGQLESGMNKMELAVQQDADIAGEISRRCTQVADEFKKKGDHEGATLLYECALRISPTDLWNKVHLAEIAEARSDPDSAERLYGEVLDSAPESFYSALRLDALLVRGERYEYALSYWKRLTEKYPGEAVPKLYFGISLERIGDMQGAKTAYQEAHFVKPDHAAPLYRLGALYVQEGNTEEGIEIMKEAALKDSNLAAEIAERCSKLASEIYDEGDIDTAVRMYTTALEIFPDGLWPKVNLAKIYESQGEHASARRLLQEVLSIAPESYYSAKMLQENFRSHVSAKEDCSFWHTLVDSNKDSIIPRYYLGISLEYMRNSDAALSVYTDLLKSHPLFAPALHRAGILEVIGGEPDDGIYKISLAAVLDPALKCEIASQCSEAAFYCEHDSAVLLCRLAMDLCPYDLCAWVRLGEVYEKKGMSDEAVEIYVDLLRQAPDSQDTAKRLDDLMKRNSVSTKMQQEIWQSILSENPQARIPMEYIEQCSKDSHP